MGEWWRTVKEWIKNVHETLIAIGAAVLIIGEIAGHKNDLIEIIDWIFLDHDRAFNAFLILFCVTVTSIIFMIKFFLEAKKKSSFIEHESSCRSEWQAIASDNASVDRELFDQLFLNILNPIMARPKVVRELSHAQRAIIAAIEISDRKIKENIKNLIDTIVSIIGSYTRDDCAACVKIFWGKNEDGKILMHTLQRDRRSHADSRRPDSKYLLESDSALEAALKTEQSKFASDDLKKLEQEGRYKNEHEAGWQNIYNALLIVPIPSLIPQTNTPVAALVVDNKEGRIDNEVCFHYVREFSWRLAIMFYRLNSIEEQRIKIRERFPSLSQFHQTSPEPKL